VRRRQLGLQRLFALARRGELAFDLRPTRRRGRQRARGQLAVLAAVPSAVSSSRPRFSAEASARSS